MVHVQTRADTSDPKARWHLITGETSEEVQKQIDKFINWTAMLRGMNTAEFRIPKRAGDKFITIGYTLVSHVNSYETLPVD